jgi:hypothetical protein
VRYAERALIVHTVSSFIVIRWKIFDLCEEESADNSQKKWQWQLLEIRKQNRRMMANLEILA